MNINYCQFCGGKIAEEDLAKGLGFEAANGDFICAACAVARGIPPRGPRAKTSGSRHPLPRRGSGVGMAVNPRPASGERQAVNVRPASGERMAVNPRPASGIRSAVPAKPRASNSGKRLQSVDARKIGPLAFVIALLGLGVFGGALYWKMSGKPATPEQSSNTNSEQKTTETKDSGGAQTKSEPGPGSNISKTAATLPVPANQTAEVDPFTRGLIAHWKFDEKNGEVAADSSGNHNDGKINGEVKRVPGKIGQALHFDGQTGYVGTGKSLFKDRGTFALALWARPTAQIGSRVGLAGQNDSLEFGFDNNLVTVWTPGGGELSARYNFPLNEWHHFAAIGTSVRLKIFIDGKEAAALEKKTENYGSSDFHFNIGGGGVMDDKGNFFTGDIDDVRLYGFMADEKDIKAIYEYGLKK